MTFACGINFRNPCTMFEIDYIFLPCDFFFFMFACKSVDVCVFAFLCFCLLMKSWEWLPAVEGWICARENKVCGLRSAPQCPRSFVRSSWTSTKRPRRAIVPRLTVCVILFDLPGLKPNMRFSQNTVQMHWVCDGGVFLLLLSAIRSFMQSSYAKENNLF